MKTKTKTKIKSDVDELDELEKEFNGGKKEIKEGPVKKGGVNPEPTTSKPTLPTLEEKTTPSLLKEPDYDKSYEELKEYALALSEDPTFKQINEQLAKIQGMRDRVSAMLISAIINTKKFKRIYEMMFDKEVVNREEKNQELRTSAVNNKIRNAHDAYEKAKSFEEVIKQVFNNLSSCNENLSRQVTVMQEQIRLGELSRGGWEGVPNKKL